MLGNFSIGDYFKRSNPLCVGILTSENWMGMEPEKLYVTIHPEDSEAYRIWNDEIGLEESRIIRIEGNFWDIGESSILTLKFSMIVEMNMVKMIHQKRCIQVGKMKDI